MIVIVGGFDQEEMIPTLIEGFDNAVYQPSRGVIAEHAARDNKFADKEIMSFPHENKLRFKTEAEFCEHVRAMASEAELLLWWYPKDDRPADLVESLSCPTVYFTWDDPMSLMWGRDDARGFSHAVTSCLDSLDYYAKRGIAAMHTLPPISPSLHGLVKPIREEACDIAMTFYALYDGQASWLNEQIKRRHLIELAGEQAKYRTHVYGGWGRSDFTTPKRSSYRGFRGAEEMPSVFASAKISVTQHPQVQARGYVSPRDTVALASGSFLLSDRTVGLVNNFDFDMYYSTPGEYVAQLRRWLVDEDGRKQIAYEARTFLFNNHTGSKFAERLLEFVL